MPDEPDFEAEGLMAGVDESKRPARIRLLNWLLDQGVSLEDLKREAAGDRLALMPADMALGMERNRYTPVEIAEKAQLDPEDFLRLTAALGFPRPELDQRTFDDADLAAAVRLGGSKTPVCRSTSCSR